ncbi:hypothetical protein ACFX2K_035977 [Malus domestica]
MAHNSVPPGFVSRTSFMLKREKTAEETNSSNAFVDASNEEPDPLAKSCLPKGVTHGCPDCSGCRKVTGRWHPEEARTDLLEEAPLFYPTEEVILFLTFTTFSFVPGQTSSRESFVLVLNFCL